MPIIARRPESNFTPAPEGLHQAVCVDVWEPWESENPFKSGDMVDQTRIVWALEAVNPETGRAFQVSQIYRLSLHEKAKLRQHLEAWRGRKFTEKELEGFDLEQLIGKNCQIQVIHNVKEGGSVFANVQAIVPLGKGMVKLGVPEGYARKRDRAAQGQSAHEDASSASADEALPF